MNNTFDKENEKYKLAKQDCELYVKHLSFVLQRILDRIDSAFPKRQDGGYGRQSKAFSRSMMFGFLTDTARDLREAYNQFAMMYNAYAQLPAGFAKNNAMPKSTTSDGQFFLSAKYSKRTLALFAPIAIKSNKAHINASPYMAEVCWAALRSVPSDLFAGVSRVQEYLVMVYPASAKAGDAIDLDNIDTKVFGDVLFAKIQLDDNGYTLPTIVSYSIFSDELDQGFYTLILPDTEVALTKGDIENRLKELYKTGFFLDD